MHQFNHLVQAIRDFGHVRNDRTGTGIVGLFGHQMAFDLSEGFPLLGTKYTPFRLIASELLFFVAAHTNVSYLHEHGNRIWNEWADKHGNLGPIYGHQWRRYNGKPDNVPQPIPQIPDGFKPTVYGVGSSNGRDRSDPVSEMLYRTWKGMLARCYHESGDNYGYYGRRGVSVCSDWLVFERFRRDVVELPGWEGKVANPSNVQLDKDSIGDGFHYSPNHCKWLTRSENQRAKSSKVFHIAHDDGRTEEVCDQQGFINKHELPQGNFSAMLRGERKSCKGWRLIRSYDRKRGFDQLSAVIENLKNNPLDRRHLVMAWNPEQQHLMALPPCHVMFQFYARPLTQIERAVVLGIPCQQTLASSDDPHATLDQLGVPRYELSCQLYQRSADVFLGVPFNVASYSLLTHMIAHLTNMTVGEFIWTGGDVHLYQNHSAQVDEYLDRTVNESEHPLPQLRIIGNPQSIDDFTLDSFEIVGYKHHGVIQAPISV